MKQTIRHNCAYTMRGFYCALLALAVLFISSLAYFGTLHIERASVVLRGSFPAIADSEQTQSVTPVEGMMARAAYDGIGPKWIRIAKNDRDDNLPLVSGGLLMALRDKQTGISLPYFPNSKDNSAFFTVTAEASYSGFSSGLIRIQPHDCIASIQVNGIDVAQVRTDMSYLRCWNSTYLDSYLVDLSQYLTRGPNEVRINLLDIGHRLGVNLATIYSLPVRLAITAYASMLVVLLCVLLIPSTQLIVFRRYLTITSMSLSGVITLFVFQAIVEGRWSWASAPNIDASHLPALCVEFLPIPFVFCLWLRVIEREREMSLRFSALASALSSAAFIMAEEVSAMAQNLSGFPILVQYPICAGVIAGLFVLVPFMEAWRQAAANPRLALVAIIAASSACFYYVAGETMWNEMCRWTTEMVYAILHLGGAEIHIATDKSVFTNFSIVSPYFTAVIFAGCNGLEGIFLFIFMLSVFVMMDWELFKGWHLSILYMVGVIYMFMVNAFRIASVFFLGYAAYQPDASPMARALKGAPITLFHTYVGWVFYLLAFIVFITAISRCAIHGNVARK